MKSVIKWLLAIAGIIVVMGIAAIFILPRVINPNDYRDQISNLVHEETGMYLQINGDMAWSVFPWVGLSINDLTIDDTRQQPLGTLKHIAVRVKLLPLLQKKLNISTLELDGLNLTMVVDESGHANWQPAGGLAVSDTATSSAQTHSSTSTSAQNEETSNSSSPILEDLNISGITINDITIHYKDIPANNEVTVRNAQLTTGAISFGEPFQLTSSFELDNKTPAIKARINLAGMITPDPKQASYTLDDMRLSVMPVGPSNPDTLDVTGNIAIVGKDLNGQVRVAPVDLSAFLTQLNFPLPPLAGKDAVLRNVSLGTKIKASDSTLALTEMFATVDNNELKGRFTITDFNKQAMSFDLTGNDIVVDPYLPVAAEPSDTQASTGKQTQTPSAQKEASASKATLPASGAAASDAVIIPVDVIKTLNVQGKAQLASLTVKGFHFEKPTLEVKAANGLAQITNLSAGFYEGNIKAAAGIDVRGNLAVRPQVSTKADITGISIPALARQMTGLDKVTGKTNANVKLLTHGLTQQQLTQGLNGTIDFNIADGALLGTNFNEMVCGIIAKVRKEKSTKTDWPDQTTFQKLQGSVRITDGIARNNDLTASLDQLNLKGDGEVNLLDQSLDYHLGLTITGDTADAEDSACRINEKYADIAWPVRCKGKLGGSNLCGIDDQRLGNTLAKIAEKEVKSKLQKKLQDKLGEGLKGLFN